MDTIMQSLAGLDNFALYFGLSIVFVYLQIGVRLGHTSR